MTELLVALAHLARSDPAWADRATRGENVGLHGEGSTVRGRAPPLVAELAEALREQISANGFLLMLVHFLCGAAGEETLRDLDAEETAIAYLLCGILSAADVAAVEWAEQYRPIAEAIEIERWNESAADCFERGPVAWISRVAQRACSQLETSPFVLARTLGDAIRRLPDADPAEVVVGRLIALAQQRLALAAAVRAVRELRLPSGDPRVAAVHLREAVHALEAI